MYGNNISSPFMVNSMPYNMMGTPMMGNMMRSAPMMRTMMPTGAMGARRGLSSLLGLGRGTGSFNISNLLNGASKTLGIVNQAIPIVKEVGPMMNNMRSMLKIASIFKDETDSNNANKKEDKINKEDISIKENSTNTNTNTSTTSQATDNKPNFFL